MYVNTNNFIKDCKAAGAVCAGPRECCSKKCQGQADGRQVCGE